VAKGGLALALTVGLAVLAGRSAGAPSARGGARPEPAPPPSPVPAAPPAAIATGPSPRIAPRAPTAPPVDPEDAVTDRVRLLVDADPTGALDAAAEGERRFPDGRMADERSYLKMRALVHLGRIGAARDEAEAFFERFPDSDYAESAYRLTGVHPRPAPPSGRGSGR
jgi:hypothetical protein